MKPIRTKYISGSTSRIGYIGATYEDIVKVLGKPDKAKSGSDMHVMWVFKIADPDYTGSYRLYSIYDDDFGNDAPIETCTLWTVAGSRGKMGTKLSNASMSDIGELFPTAIVGVDSDFWKILEKTNRKYSVNSSTKTFAADVSTERQIKQMQDRIRVIRKKRKKDERQSIDKVDQIQHKIRDLKYKDTDKPIDKPAEKTEARMSIKTNAIQSRAKARLESAHIVKASKQFFAPYEVDTWQERDNLQINVTDAAKQDVWSVSDEDARSLVEDGFIKMGRGGADENSVIDYLRSVNILPKDDPKCLVDKVYESWDEDALEAGETDDKGFEYQDEEKDFEDLVSIFKACDDFSTNGASNKNVYGMESEEDMRSGNTMNYSYHFSRKNKPGADVMWTAAMRLVRRK